MTMGFALCALVQPAQAARTVLPIQPLAQHTSEWCWAASATMVLQYYGMPALNSRDYQCGVVAFAFSGNAVCRTNCYNCAIPAGAFENMTVLLRRYGYFARTYLNLQAPDLYGNWENRALTFDEAATSLGTRKSPIIAGISANGFSNPYLEPQHIVVVVGYDDQRHTLIVNDPWPVYTLKTDPYVERGATKLHPGQYEIGYDAFVSMLWNKSIDDMYTQ